MRADHGQALDEWLAYWIIRIVLAKVPAYSHEHKTMSDSQHQKTSDSSTTETRGDNDTLAIPKTTFHCVPEL